MLAGTMQPDCRLHEVAIGQGPGAVAGRPHDHRLLEGPGQFRLGFSRGIGKDEIDVVGVESLDGRRGDRPVHCVAMGPGAERKGEQPAKQCRYCQKSLHDGSPECVPGSGDCSWI